MNKESDLKGKQLANYMLGINQAHDEINTIKENLAVLRAKEKSLLLDLQSWEANLAGQKAGFSRTLNQ